MCCQRSDQFRDENAVPTKHLILCVVVRQVPVPHELDRVCPERAQRILGAHLHGLDRVVSILLVSDIVVDCALNHILKSQNSEDVRCIDLQSCAAPERLQMRCQVGVESVAKASESSCNNPVFANDAHVALAFLKPVVYRLKAVILRHKKRNF